MHIAICDDNVADRKQLERLLKRESDKRIATSGVLYIDSYGHPDSLLKNPMQYDAFFIDVCNTEGYNGIDVVHALTKAGSTSPVILCSSLISYAEQKDSLPERALFLDKPLKVADISAVLDDAQKIKDSAIPMIELRENNGTHYVTEADILYAVEEGHYLTVTLQSGQKVSLRTSALNFFSQVENYPSFFAPNNRCVVNARHITSIRLHRITMCDGRKFSAIGAVLGYAKTQYEETH